AEFRLTARRRYVLGALRLLDRWGALRATHDALALSASTVRALRAHPGAHCEALAAALLLAPVARRSAVLDRLRPPRRVRDAVEGTARLLAAADEELDATLLESLAATPLVARIPARWL